MEKALERALDRADYIIESVRQNPPKRKYSSSGGKSLHEKLYDIYVEECGKEPEVTEELRSNVNLLEKLLMRESLSCLVVNLYPGNRGYSLMLEGENGSYTEILQLPYEEGELLEYLDAEELPPVLVDLLEKCPVNMFHSGCVIAEIRDYRQSNREAPSYQSRHILLRPTMQTLAHDIESIASDNENWTEEDKLMLESQLILATAEPLCLEPCVSVAFTENRLLYNKQKMNNCWMKRSFKRYSAASLRQHQEQSGPPPPPGLTASTSYNESTADQEYDLNISKAKNYVDTWKQRPCDLAVPLEVDMEKYAKGERSVRYDDSQPTVLPVPEGKGGSLFVCEAGDQTQTRKLNFEQPLSDSPFCGQINSGQEARSEGQLCHAHSSPDDQSSSWRPMLKADPGKVVSLSKELVQENTKCPVKMPHSSSGPACLSPLSPKKEEAEEPQATSVGPSVLEKGVELTPPSTNLPSSSGKSSSGNSFTPQLESTSPKHQPPVIASTPPGSAHQSPVEVNPVSMPPADNPFAGSSALIAVITQVMSSSGLSVTKDVSPVGGTETVVRDSEPAHSSTIGARDPSGVNPSSPSGGQPINAQATAPQVSSQPGVQHLLKNASDLSALTELQVPQGSVVSNTQQLTPQPQQKLCQLTAEQQHQGPSSSLSQQPVSQGSSAQDSTRQNPSSTAQEAVFVNLSEMGRGQGHVQQAQTTVKYHRRSAKKRARQRVPMHMVLRSSVFRRKQQPQPQEEQPPQQQ